MIKSKEFQRKKGSMKDTSQARVNVSFGSNRVFITAALLISLPYFVKVLHNPILYPFVDDWVLAPWLLGSEELHFGNLFQLVNGHQHSLIKLLLVIQGKLFGTSLEVITLMAILLAVITFSQLTFLVLAEVKFRHLSYKFAAALAITAILFTPRQFQNIFLIICIPWILSLFLITTYLYFKRLPQTRVNQAVWLICLGLAPFSNGLGLTLPLLVTLQTIYKILSKEINLKDFMVTFYCLGLIFFSFIFPTSSFFMSKGISSDQNTFSNFIFILHHPIDTFKFLMISIANPFVPWSSQYLQQSIMIGVFISALTLYLILTQKPKKKIKSIFFDNELLLLGVIFIFTLAISRMQALGVIGAVEPRYTTGALLVAAGSLKLIVQKTKIESLAVVTLTILAIFTFAVGIRTGFDYYEYRQVQSIEIQKCYDNFPRISAGKIDVCVDLVFKNALGISRDKLVVNLNRLGSTAHF